MKKGSYLYLFIFLIPLLFSGCFEKKLKDINVGVESWYPPFSFEIGGEIKGFDIDLLRAVLSKMGYNAKFIVADFDKLESKLESGEIDILASGISATNKRLEKFDFSDSYYKPSFAIVYKRIKFGDFISLDQFDKMTIGAQGATIMSQFVNFIKSERNINVKLFLNNFDLLGALRSGDVSAIVLENLQAEIITQNNPDLSFFVISHKEMSGFDDNENFQYGFAFKKGSKLVRKFNKILSEFDLDGKIDILKLRWFSGYGVYGNLLK